MLLPAKPESTRAGSTIYFMIDCLFPGPLLLQGPLAGIGMQQLMRPVGQGLFQVLAVERLYRAVLVRIPDGLLHIQTPQNLAAALFGKLSQLRPFLKWCALWHSFPPPWDFGGV